MGLGCPDVLRVETRVFLPAELEAIADTPGQVKSWIKHYTNNGAAIAENTVLVTSALGTYESFRKVALADIANPAILQQLVKVLIMRRMLRVCAAALSYFD